MTDDRRPYLLRRMAQERAAAERAGCARTRGIHLDLASRYSEQVAAIDRQAAATVAPLRPAWA